MNQQIDLGRWGEKKAVSFLKRKGYKIRELNFRSPFGEIDIIARDKNCLCFIEVKTRTTSLFGLPEESVDFRKEQKIIKSAIFYLNTQNNEFIPDIRFDLIGIYNHKIKLIKNAFTL